MSIGGLLRWVMLLVGLYLVLSGVFRVATVLTHESVDPLTSTSRTAYNIVVGFVLILVSRSRPFRIG